MNLKAYYYLTQEFDVRKVLSLLGNILQNSAGLFGTNLFLNTYGTVHCPFVSMQPIQPLNLKGGRYVTQ